VLDLNPICHGIAQEASDPGERGGPDLSFAQCVSSEQALRSELVKEWSGLHRQISRIVSQKRQWAG
jgi:hypothetical protein